MIILLSCNKELNIHINKLDNVTIVKNIYNCYQILIKPDLDCYLLLLDAKMFTNELFDNFVTWIIRQNLPIHTILIYNTENNSNITKGIRRLNKKMYKTKQITQEQLIKALE